MRALGDPWSAVAPDEACAYARERADRDTFGHMARKPPSCGVAIPRRAFHALPPPAPRKAPVRRPGARPAPSARAKAPEAVTARPRAPLGLPAPSAATPRSTLPPFPGARARGPLAHLVGVPRAVAPRTVDLYPPGPSGMALRAATPRPAKAPRPSTKRDPILRPMAVPLREGAPRIVKLVKIIDTRERECVGGMFRDVFAPIPGTGIAHDCYRCGAEHEVHAYVELEDGREVIVGTGCARREALDAGDQALARIISSADRRAKAIRALRAEIAQIEPVVREGDEARRAIRSMPAPPVQFVYVKSIMGNDDGTYSPNRYELYDVVCGDVRHSDVYRFHPYYKEVEGALSGGASRDQRDQALWDRRGEESGMRQAWVKRRLGELGVDEEKYETARRALDDARMKLKKLLAKGG